VETAAVAAVCVVVECTDVAGVVVIVLPVYELFRMSVIVTVRVECRVADLVTVALALVVLLLAPSVGRADGELVMVLLDEAAAVAAALEAVDEEVP
jgi:hypothetical protein